MPRRWLAALAVSALSFAAEMPPHVREATTLIRADSLKGHVSFLASDLLEGRGTGSRGLDLAAEYIAAQYRRAGLAPAGENGTYFQTARFVTIEPNREGLKFDLKGLDAPVPVDSVNIDNPVACALSDLTAVKFAEGVDVNGKAVFVSAPDFRALLAAQRAVIAAGKPALIVLTGPSAGRFRPRRLTVSAEDRAVAVPTVSIRDEAFADLVKAAEPGPLPFTVAVTIPQPVETPITMRNVAAVIRGSGEKLKDTFELVTAHYDHLGIKPGDGPGDRIYNGANDDASGVATLIEVASALKEANARPRRSILFVAVFGEESGLLGSRYYARHPLAPLASTIADVNLEHMGRTDSNLGEHLNMVNFTGFDYSDIPAIFQKAGDLTGISVVKDEKNSDPYFARSDNQALADAGVPAHTMSVSYEFPDYHQVGDEWEKLDYDNMARVDRMVAVGLMLIADSDKAPQWNESDPKVKRYVDAAHALGR